MAQAIFKKWLKNLAADSSYTLLVFANSSDIRSIFTVNMAIQLVASACCILLTPCGMWLRSKTPILSRPKNPPSKRSVPCLSFWFTHQVKLINNFWNACSKNLVSPLPVRDLSFSYTFHTAQECTGGLTSLKFHS